MTYAEEPEMQPESPPEPSLDEFLDKALSGTDAPADAGAAVEPVPEEEAPAPEADVEDTLEFSAPDLSEELDEVAPPSTEPSAPAPEEPSVEPGPDPRVGELEAENADLKDRYMRVMAELENVRKRSRREVETSINLAKANVLRELLEVADNFSRALDSASFAEGSPEHGLAEGVRLIYVQFMDILRQNGCERIPAKGQPFDPNLHEAISQFETDEVPSQHVIEVVQEGYMMNDHVLRPARVVVAV